MGNTFRVCVVCQEPYEAGTWREHKQAHPSATTQVQYLVAQGLSQAEIARRLGVSRQRVNAIIRNAKRRKQRYAHEQVFIAVLQGRLIRGECEVQSDDHKGVINAHHRNGYDDPLDVVWLCARHHHIEHWAARRAAKDQEAA